MAYRLKNRRHSKNQQTIITFAVQIFEITPKILIRIAILVGVQCGQVNGLYLSLNVRPICGEISASFMN